MLKKILASLVLTVGLYHPSIASEKALGFATEFPCGSLEQLAGVLEEHGEEPALTATSTREVAGKFHTVPMVIFVNMKTKSWTMVEKYTDNIYCVAGLGDGITPYVPKQSL
jgi:hypothetical protein